MERTYVRREIARPRVRACAGPKCTRDLRCPQRYLSDWHYVQAFLPLRRLRVEHLVFLVEPCCCSHFGGTRRYSYAEQFVFLCAIRAKTTTPKRLLVMWVKADRIVDQNGVMIKWYRKTVMGPFEFCLFVSRTRKFKWTPLPEGQWRVAEQDGGKAPTIKKRAWGTHKTESRFLGAVCRVQATGLGMTAKNKKTFSRFLGRPAQKRRDASE